MTPQDILAYSVLGLFLCHVLYMVALGIVAWVVVQKINSLRNEAQAVLQSARSVAANAEIAARGVASSVHSAGRVVSQVENTVAALSPRVSLLTATANTVRAPNLKMRLMGLALGIGMRYLLHRRAARR